MLVGITRPIILMTSNYLFYCAQQSRPFSLIIKANFSYCYYTRRHVWGEGGRGTEREREREGGREREKERRGEREELRGKGTQKVEFGRDIMQGKERAL